MRLYYFTIATAVALAFIGIITACTKLSEGPSALQSTSTTTSTAASTSTSTAAAVVPVCPATIPTDCPKKGAYQAIDMNLLFTEKLAVIFKCQGIDTVLKYYDWISHETIKGKIPTDAEWALLKKYGFKFGAVFQHNNGVISTFADTAGEDRYNRDPKEALANAAHFNQPKGSGIYFGVDGDLSSTSDLAAVKKYFSAIAPKIRAAGFRIGMYGGGAVCTMLQTAKLIDLPCWITASAYGWAGTTAALNATNYGLKQYSDKSCAGVGVDFNNVNPAKSDIGTWQL